MDKSIIRVKKDSENPYVMMNKLFLSEVGLSWKAKGLLSYLLSKPDDWKVIIESLIKQSTDGERSTRSALNELKEFNYLQRYPVFINKVIDRWESVVYEQPNQDGKIKSVFILENGKEIVNYVYDSVQSEETSLLVRNVDVHNVDVPYVDVDNAGLLINDLTNKEITNNDNNNIYIPFSEIVDYLNLKANTKYRASSSKTKDLLKARFNENPEYTLEDFKIVIDKKCSEWLGSQFEQYLKPDTLFSNKFEGYLNQKIQPQKFVNAMKTGKKSEFVDYGGQRDYDFKELEKGLLGW